MPKTFVVISTIALFIFLGGVAVYVGLRPAPDQQENTREEGERVKTEQPTVVIPQPSEETQETAVKPEDSSVAEPIDTSNWKVYRNMKYNYEIKYPPSFRVEDMDGEIRFTDPGIEKSLQANEDYKFGTEPLIMSVVVEKVDPQKTLESWLQDFWELDTLEEFRISPEESGYWVDCLEKTVVGGLPGYKIHTWSQAWGEQHYYVKYQNLIFDISRGAISLDCTDKDPHFNAMISSFKIIK